MERFLMALPIVFGLETVGAECALIGSGGIVHGRFHRCEAHLPSPSG